MGLAENNKKNREINILKIYNKFPVGGQFHIIFSDKIKVINRWSWQRPNGFQKGISFQNKNKLNFSKSKPVESQIS